MKSHRHLFAEQQTPFASGAQEAQILLPAGHSGENMAPTSWSCDGQFLLYTISNPKTRTDLWVLPMNGDSKPFPFLKTEFIEREAQFSPDRRWIAYVSQESGRDEVYVRAFSAPSSAGEPPADGKWMMNEGRFVFPRGAMRVPRCESGVPGVQPRAASEARSLDREPSAGPRTERSDRTWVYD